MKRSTLISSALFAVLASSTPAFAEDSTSTVVWDHSPWDNEQVLKLFSDAWDQGRNYPTKAEFETIGMTSELEFARSHTRQREIYKDADKDVVKGINHDRKLWCNLPAGYGKNTGGYPSTQFDQDVFSMWNYTAIFGAWNYGFLEAPGCWLDAAHKNGTRMYGGIKFFESWTADGSESAFQKFIETKNSDGTFKYARAFVNAAAFFGSDGYNYNSEGTIYSKPDFYNFHAAVQHIADEIGVKNFGIGQYTQNASLTVNSAPYLYGNKENGKTYDCMLNYSGNKLAYRSVSSSLQAADEIGLGNGDLYQGQLLVNLSGDYWTQMNTEATKPMNICIWGEHDQSRFFQFRVGDDPISVQANYQKLLEKAFSGANRNPLNRPDISNNWGSFQVAGPELADQQLNNSPGFASMFPERASVGGNLPFETYFSLGNGDSYFYKGKISTGSWYNMSQQDVVPTYRWLLTAKGDMTKAANDLDVVFSHEDSYIGGSCLRLKGATSAGNDLVLYRTHLTPSEGNVKAVVALKGQQGASNVSVILKKEGSNTWIEVPYGDLSGTTWQQKTLDVSGISKGDVIEYIGIRVNKSDANFDLKVGQIKITDDFSAQPAVIRDNSLVVEVREENAKSLSVRLNWEPNYDSFSTSVDKFGMVYNDEINIDHFEILYKEGENGKVKEVGRTAQWATYIGALPMTQTTEAYIGVRSVSTDLKTYSPVQWVEIPHYAGELPEVEEEDPYGKTWMSSVGNGTMETCTRYIYAEKVTTEGATQNLNYYVENNPLYGNSQEQYYYAGDHKLILNQGQKVKLFFKGYNSGTSESLKYDFLNVYIDYDGNYSFLDADEVLGKFGNLNQGTDAIVNPGLELEFTVPEDAHIGESRLRIVGSDAWTPHPGPTGGTVKGYSIDFPVEIVGTNADRGPAPTYKDFVDKGEVDEPEDLAGVGAISVDGEATVEIVDGIAYFTSVDKAWFYDMNGRCVKFVKDATTSANVSDLINGVYVVKMQNGQVITSAKVVVK